MGSKLMLLFPEGRTKALTFSYDDGVQQDKRLVELLDQHGMKGTFNLNSGCFSAEGTVFQPGKVHRRMTEKEIVELFGNGNHEIAVHTLTHPYLQTLPTVAVVDEVLQDRKNLEKLFGGVVRGMAYPYGTCAATDSVVSVLKSCGIAYSRTTVSTEKFDLPTDWLRLPATAHHKNPRLMELAQKFAESEPGDNAKLFYLWGHTYEFERDNNWNVIETFLDYMAGREDAIWYATNIEICDYVRDFGRLEWSADFNAVHNPTATGLWFRANGKTCFAGAGETVRVE